MGSDELDLQGGGQCAGYAWGQSQEEVHVYVTVPPGTAPANVHVRVTPNTLMVALKDAEDGAKLVEGGLFRGVKCDESTWMVEGKAKDVVHVYLEKADSDVMWSCVMEGHEDQAAGANFLAAAREGRASDLVRMMRDADVDVNYADPVTGFTALHWAAATGKLEVLHVLLELSEGLAVDACDKDGQGPLITATQNMQTKATLALLAAGANPNVANKAGGTPLMIAAGVGEVTLIKAMLRAGAEVNAQDHGGLTAAMHAAKMCNSAVIVMLIQEANADISLRCKEGKTALDYAGDQPTVDTLSENSIFLQAHGKEFI